MDFVIVAVVYHDFVELCCDSVNHIDIFWLNSYLNIYCERFVIVLFEELKLFKLK